MNDVPPAPLRLLLVDDHPVILAGLRLLFAGDATISISGEAATASSARQAAEAQQPDLIITDLSLGGGGDGLSLVKGLIDAAPTALTVVYSSHDELVWARHVLQAGARAYVSKAEPLDAVATAVDQVRLGHVHVSPAVHRLLASTGGVSGVDAASATAALSARELEVFTLMGSGLSRQALAHRLGLSTKTVGTYQERLKAKLGLDSVRLLDQLAADHGSPARWPR